MFVLKHRIIFFPQMCLRRPLPYLGGQGSPITPARKALCYPCLGSCEAVSLTYLLPNRLGTDLCSFAHTRLIVFQALAHVPSHTYPHTCTLSCFSGNSSLASEPSLLATSPMTGTSYLSCLVQKGQGLWELASCMCRPAPLIHEVP